MPFSVRIFAAMPPAWPEPIISTSTVSVVMSLSVRIRTELVGRPGRSDALRGTRVYARGALGVYVGLDRRPVELCCALLPPRVQRVKPNLRVHGGGANISMSDVDEV